MSGPVVSVRRPSGSPNPPTGLVPVTSLLLEPTRSRAARPASERAIGVTTMTTFADLGLSDDLTRRLAEQGLTEPTPVQSAGIPELLAGNDLAAEAPTGSGKTLAFGLPLLQRCGVGESRRPAGLVLTPTRELATQITDVLVPLAGRDGPSVAAVFGGVGIGPQVQRLRRGVDLVVGCPGRLEDLLERGDLRLDAVEFVVVDEADRMSDVGFLPAIRRLLDLTPRDRQTALFSATLGGPVRALIEEHQRAPRVVRVAAPESDGPGAVHLAVVAEPAERTRVTATIVEAAGPSIVFCRTRHRADRLARQLDRLGVPAQAIHGGRSQAQRTRALDALHDGRIRALVATDVAARGIHVEDLACVVHVDPPEDAETYVHRSGRTGRAGATGVVVSLVEPAAVRSGRLRRTAAPSDVDVELVAAGELADRVRSAAPEGGNDRPNRRERPARGATPDRPRRSGSGRGGGSGQGRGGRPGSRQGGHPRTGGPGSGRGGSGAGSGAGSGSGRGGSGAGSGRRGSGRNGSGAGSGSGRGGSGRQGSGRAGSGAGSGAGSRRATSQRSSARRAAPAGPGRRGRGR